MPKIITESFDQKKRNYRANFLLLTDESDKNRRLCKPVLG